MEESRDMAEETEHTRFSRDVHRIIVFVNGGILGFLQLTSQATTSSLLDSSLCFWSLALISILLRLSEFKLRTPVFRRFVGDMSHLFGSLAALVLISVVCSTFALVLLPVWFLRLFVVVFLVFKEIFVIVPEANQSHAGPTDP
ncbi:PREDICTED: uncharacterized protein LOC104813327 [Tarenaya hassleriana]|uniref:uncharacterized protein LOC104813327 n=1 Tax=Tarenaya hassleriana TaxID=28532 RepID=UPI00053C962F|nr:PREDICTED: uncharacterized protein LOC104813327 [Tarenaya hassleriana]